MICIYFTKSKLYFTRLGYLETVKQLSGYPAWEMDYNSHGDTYTNCLAQVPDDSLDIIQKMSKFQEGPGIQMSIVIVP